MAKVGIYWVYGESLIGRVEQHHIVGEYLGVCDSNFDHYSSWRVVRSSYRDLMGVEYDEIDRGRCVFLPRKAFHVVYCSRAVATNKAVQKKIRSFFQATGKCYFIRDDHYA